jgi:hypothetical protein
MAAQPLLQKFTADSSSVVKFKSHYFIKDSGSNVTVISKSIISQEEGISLKTMAGEMKSVETELRKFRREMKKQGRSKNRVEKELSQLSPNQINH